MKWWDVFTAQSKVHLTKWERAPGITWGEYFKGEKEKEMQWGGRLWQAPRDQPLKKGVRKGTVNLQEITFPPLLWPLELWAVVWPLETGILVLFFSFFKSKKCTIYFHTVPTLTLHLRRSEQCMWVSLAASHLGIGQARLYEVHNRPSDHCLVQ